MHWVGDTLYVFNSWEHPWRNQGPDLFHLERGSATIMDPALNKLWLWMESTWKDDDGTLYGWIHNEFPNVCPNTNRSGLPADGYPTLARIGAVKSRDNGANWQSLGFVMDGRPNDLKCDGQGPWYAGGVGDLCVFLDDRKEYFYIFFASFAPKPSEQGLCVARMPFADRDSPVGQGMIWHNAKCETDKLASRTARLFLDGESKWEIRFKKAGE